MRHGVDDTGFNEVNACGQKDNSGMCCQVADDMEAAVTSALDQGFRTGDLMSDGMKQLSCSDMGQVLLKAVRQPAMAH